MGDQAILRLANNCCYCFCSVAKFESRTAEILKDGLKEKERYFKSYNKNYVWNIEKMSTCFFLHIWLEVAVKPISVSLFCIFFSFPCF